MTLLPDLVWSIVGFVLTLMVLSYIIKDNFLFRMASYILIGAAAGYVFSLVVYQVIIQRLILPLANALPSGEIVQIILAVVPVLLSIMLLFKLSSGPLAKIGNLPMAYLVGVGAAVLITGAITGTILGQARATINLFNFQNNGLIEAIIVLIGTIMTLAYFHFGTRSAPTSSQTARRNPFIEVMARGGKLFIGITLGA
jgi:hypothetical protein